MREILFRAKRIDNGDWVYGDVYHNFDYDPCGIKDCCGSNLIMPHTVGQFAGLVCRNHAKVFEGDVVKNEYGSVGVVEFHHGQFVVRYREKYWHSLNNHMPCKIIGNIHDHPELLRLCQ